MTTKDKHEPEGRPIAGSAHQAIRQDGHQANKVIPGERGFLAGSANLAAEGGYQARAAGGMPQHPVAPPAAAVKPAPPASGGVHVGKASPAGNSGNQSG